MKYIIFKHKDLLMPVIFPDHITHSQIKIEDAIPISAGFVAIDLNGFTNVYGESDSLNLIPHEEDRFLLDNSLNNRGTVSFLNYSR